MKKKVEDARNKKLESEIKKIEQEKVTPEQMMKEIDEDEKA